jgi:hypothetical protein
MTATNHVVAGALIATYLHNPWLAIPVAVASHFALDSLPHIEYLKDKTDNQSLRFFIRLAADCGLAASILVTILLLQPAGVALILVCGIAAASPDLMWLYYLVLKKGPESSKRPAIVKLHAKVQKYTSVKLWPVELAWLLITGGLLATRLH